MATTLYFRNLAADMQRATNTAKLNGSTSGWLARKLLTTADTAGITDNASAVAGPTAGVEVCNTATSNPGEWITDPLAADVTISGVTTGNLWAAEADMNENVAINYVIDKVAATDGTITQIVASARTTEVALTTRAVNNFTATPGAGVACNRGDRIRVRVFGDDAGTMGATGTFTFGYSGNVVQLAESWVQLTENLTFETSDPAGTQLFLTSTAAGINPGSANELEMWTSRGAGSADLVTNTAAGWTAGIQITDSGGGTAQEWYTKQLTAFTLAGKALVNVRAKESDLAAEASVRAEIAICASDGSAPAVWGTAAYNAANQTGELTASDAANVCYVSGDDTSVTSGQRLRLRIYVEDNALTPLVTGKTVTVSYNGSSGAAAGDTYLTIPQSVTEFVTANTIPYLTMAHQGPA